LWGRSRKTRLHCRIIDPEAGLGQHDDVPIGCQRVNKNYGVWRSIPFYCHIRKSSTTGPYSDGPRIIAATNTLLGRDYRVVYIQSVITHPIARLLTGGLNAPGSPGIQMDRRLLRVPDAPTFVKYRPDAFTNPKLDEYLRSQSVNHVIIVGLDGAGCVVATMMGALNRGYKVTAARQGIATESGKSLDELSLEWQKLGATVVDLP
jgi:nicotinamidase-related amidase